MFNHRFFSNVAMFDAHVYQAKNPQPPTPRFIALTRFAHDMLGWFEDQKKLTSVKLTCVAIPETESPPVSIRIRHHFVLSAIGGQVPASEDYALDNLPWNLLSNGVFELRRDDQAVQDFLALPDTEILTYEGLVHALALRIDAAFEDIQVAHDVGLLTSTR